MQNRVKIIANPISGRGRSRLLAERLRAELAARGMNAEVSFTRRKGDAAKAAAQTSDDFAAACAVGGDGTVNEVLNGIAGRNLHLAILPAGLSNVVAAELGIPRDPAAVAQAIAGRSTAAVDLCLADGRYFIAMAGAGWDAHVVHSIARSRRSPLGYAGYILPIARSLLLYDFPAMEVVADGVPVSREAGLVVLGNVRRYGGPFSITSRADFADGCLDAYLVRRAHAVKVLSLYLGALLGDHTRHGGAMYLRGKKFELTGPTRVPVHIDGEAAGYLPRTFETTGIKQLVLVPR
jgi:YegS/Rv2252/BmrU family lipid kinase